MKYLSLLWSALRLFHRACTMLKRIETEEVVFIWEPVPFDFKIDWHVLSDDSFEELL